MELRRGPTNQPQHRDVRSAGQVEHEDQMDLMTGGGMADMFAEEGDSRPASDGYSRRSGDSSFGSDKCEPTKIDGQGSGARDRRQVTS